MLDVLGFDPDDLVGKSVYDYHHALDNDVISSSFKNCKYFCMNIKFINLKNILDWNTKIVGVGEHNTEIISKKMSIIK